MIDPMAIRGAAALTGSVNAALELFGVNMIMRFSGFSAAKRALMGQLPMQILKSRTLRPLVTRLGKSIVGSAAGEGLTEALQESTTIAFGTLLINMNTTQDRDLFTRDNLERALYSAAVGAFMGTSISLGASPVVIAIDRAAMRKATRARGSLPSILRT